MTLVEIIATIFLFAGAFFVLVASIGVVRFPDFYSRTHAAGKGDTLGIALILIGLAIYEGGTLNTAKFVLIAVFIGIANPTAAHAIARAAYKLGLKPYLGRSKPKDDDSSDNLKSKI
ncbi:MAG: monovalent cation/H(+) antiporter subunit G [Bacteroidota bacterium]|nr:monovalent cation/H(+) antiporter subunit G [Bacteroidota bacterium]